MARIGLRIGVTCLGMVWAAISLQAGETSQAGLAAKTPAIRPAASHVSSQQSFLDKYCVACHNQRSRTAGLMLDTSDVGRVASNAELWEKVRKKLRASAMPPAGSPKPDKAARDVFLSTLEAALDQAAAAAPNPGRPAIHRLNRGEYVNAVRDLLGLEIDGRSLLPADDSGYGFDNIADVLSVSPGLMERYLIAAKKISRWAVGDPTQRPTLAIYSLPYMTLTQDERMDEDLPFGSRGGLAFRHYFPLDAEYVLKIRLMRHQLNIGNVVRGLDVENQIDVRLDGVRVKLFTMDIRDYDSPREAGYREGEDTVDASLQVRFTAKAGMRRVGVTFPKATWYVEGVGMSRLPAATDGFASGLRTDETYGRIDSAIDRVDIQGPFNGALPEDSLSRRRIFVCRPATADDEERCAETILATLARRAYRRPVGNGDIQTLLGFFREGRTNGSFDRGIQFALARLLTDPDFLLRVEHDTATAAPATSYRVSDLDLASRLSFFLWSSIPDEELLALAEKGQLQKPAVLERQVHRMLADSRSQALLDNFFGQWLYLRNMSGVRPDPKAFVEFDDNLREAYRRETALFLESQLREDRSVIELLSANYTFVNERLARQYGIPNVYGSHFRRVQYPDDRRAGILGHGTILTVTSYANRTSPVVRGKWLLENLLGAPPPPPPDNVPPFEEQDGRAQSKTVRERMEQHRKNPVCAACHAKMDPLGFALENFDGVGKWRTEEANRAIDASGQLPDGSKFEGPAQLREALFHYKDLFIETLTEKLLTFALGRGVEFFDLPAVRQIVREAAPHDYQWSSIILGITKSTPFQQRRSKS